MLVNVKSEVIVAAHQLGLPKVISPIDACMKYALGVCAPSIFATTTNSSFVMVIMLMDLK